MSPAPAALVPMCQSSPPAPLASQRDGRWTEVTRPGCVQCIGAVVGWSRVIGSPGAFRLTNVAFGGVVVVGTFLRSGPRRGLTAIELGARVDRDLRIPCMASRLELREDF